MIKDEVETYLRDNVYLESRNAKDTIFTLMNDFVLSELDVIFRTELSEYQNTEDSDSTLGKELENFNTKLNMTTYTLTTMSLLMNWIFM